MVLTRSSRMCNFLEYNDFKIIYKRYASLYFVTICDKHENELSILEIIHHYVEVLDKYFGNVCELDLIFNFHKAYFILDELMIAGKIMEPSKKVILKAISSQEQLAEEMQDDKNGK
uniref:AP complex subunit sigma n=1 Tax=Anophryoides haemophila TaxID=46462 RepID=A0A7S3IAW4_9CILI|mmetsp:Transcript_12370/g.1857  ORF Transcript_12370/g.1857 Transcript_12370/m.1857 type:complete len:116 (+) Transcript_12370:246-593(+)